MLRTSIVKINPCQPEKTPLKQAATIIKNGGLVAFPTETVYGLGANAINPTATNAVYSVKGRPHDNPLIWHVNSITELSPHVDIDFNRCKTALNAAKITATTPMLLELIAKLFENSVTLVLPITPKNANVLTNTLAVRTPQSPIAQALIAESGCIIAAPSANTSGKPSPTCAAHVAQDLTGKIAMILDGGPTKKGLESTVIALCGEKPELLRPGAATVQTISNVFFTLFAQDISELLADFNNFNNSNDSNDSNDSNSSSTEKPISPGMKYRHYSPDTPLILLIGTPEAVSQKITQIGEQEKTAILRTCNMSLEKLAQTLFFKLREFDEQNVEKIIVEGVAETGLGLAIMNRLKKAAAEVIIL